MPRTLCIVIQVLHKENPVVLLRHLGGGGRRAPTHVAVTARGKCRRLAYGSANRAIRVLAIYGAVQFRQGG